MKRDREQPDDNPKFPFVRRGPNTWKSWKATPEELHQWAEEARREVTSKKDWSQPKPPSNEGSSGICWEIFMGWNGFGDNLTAGRRELGLKARRPARFNSRSNAAGFTRWG